MGLFRKKLKNAYAGSVDSAALARRALDFIAEGVMLIDEGGMIQFANPAAAAMAGYDAPENITGLDYTLVLRLHNQQNQPVEPQQSDLYTALRTNAAMTTRDYQLFSAQTEKRIAVALTVIPTGDSHDFRIVTFRDITHELQEENEQAEFISTASHEMRTPVASIEGYLGLCLNPQTATIDQRAAGYLKAAHAASQHLGRLFQDLLDVTKLDDKRLKAHLVPVDAVEAVRRLSDAHASDAAGKNQRYTFGGGPEGKRDKKRIEQKIYMAVDLDFLREIVDNLVGNAIKYTPKGGEVLVNVRGDGDRVIISVKDNGIGISAEDAGHVFQKFYRVDNSQTRLIGGTGLGLYLVKKRAEALHGRVWLESVFGEGSTFFVSLPRISESEYEKMRIAYANEQMVRNFSAPTMNAIESEATTPPATQPPTTTTASAPTPVSPPHASPVPASPTSASQPHVSSAPVPSSQSAKPTQPIQPTPPTSPAPSTQLTPSTPSPVPAPRADTPTPAPTPSAPSGASAPANPVPISSIPPVQPPAQPAATTPVPTPTTTTTSTPTTTTPTTTTTTTTPQPANPTPITQPNQGTTQ